MAQIITVGISDARATADPDTTLVTYALGSCIAVAMHDPSARVGGLLHFMLPDSTMATDRGRGNPMMFADTGVPALLEQIVQLGASKQRIRVFIAGGAQVLDQEGFFNIGKRNHVSLRKVLWKSGLFLHGEATGGTVSRTAWLEVSSGRFLIKEGSQAPRELSFTRGQGGLQ